MSTRMIRPLVRQSARLFALSLLVLTVGCAKKTETTTTDSTGFASTDTSHVTPVSDTARHEIQLNDANIMAMMTESDSGEVTESKLVLGKTKSADVKAFANMMIADHTKMLKDDHDLAKKTNTTPQPPAQDPNPAELTRALSEMNSMQDPKGLDVMFANHAVEDHQKVLTALQGFQNSAQNADLKAAITKAMPVVQKHLDHAKALQSKLTGAPTSAPTSAPADTASAHTMQKKKK